MDGNIYGGGTVMLTHFVRTARNDRGVGLVCEKFVKKLM